LNVHEQSSVIRTQTRRNSLGQEVGYHEEVTDSTTPDLVRHVDWGQASYDDKGRLEGFTRTTKISTTAGELGLTTTERVFHNQYDALNLITSYGSETHVTSADGSVDYTTSSERHGIVYNDLRQITEYTESNTDAYGNTGAIHWHQGGYDSAGRQVFYQEDT